MFTLLLGKNVATLSGGDKSGQELLRVPESLLGQRLHDGETRCGAGTLGEVFQIASCVDGYGQPGEWRAHRSLTVSPTGF